MNNSKNVIFLRILRRFSILNAHRVSCITRQKKKVTPKNGERRRRGTDKEKQ